MTNKGTPCDQGARQSVEKNGMPKISNVNHGEVKIIKEILVHKHAGLST